MVTFPDATPADIPIIHDLAEKIWWPTYSSIISKEQIRYMLDTIYSTETLKQAMTDGSQKFILISDNFDRQGFAAFGISPEEQNVAKLHKLYVLPDMQGKGYGRMLIEEVIRRIKQTNIHTLDLNVNRHNQAYNFYLKMGFKVLREEDIPIGPYWMNDYVMRLNL